jgi:hypothetical protein
MPNLKVAHIREQGQDMILVPLNDSFGRKTDQERTQTLGQIQAVAASAGLRGSVAAIWNGGGRTYFMGPRPWHPFLRSISLDWVSRQVNRELSW